MGYERPSWATSYRQPRSLWQGEPEGKGGGGGGGGWRTNCMVGSFTEFLGIIPIVLGNVFFDSMCPVVQRT